MPCDSVDMSSSTDFAEPRHEVGRFSDSEGMGSYISRFHFPETGTKNMPTICRQIRVLDSTFPQKHLFNQVAVNFSVSVSPHILTSRNLISQRVKINQLPQTSPNKCPTFPKPVGFSSFHL